jgi:hypothetical protein
VETESKKTLTQRGKHALMRLKKVGRIGVSDFPQERIDELSSLTHAQAEFEATLANPPPTLSPEQKEILAYVTTREIPPALSRLVTEAEGVISRSNGDDKSNLGEAWLRRNLVIVPETAGLSPDEASQKQKLFFLKLSRLLKLVKIDQVGSAIARAVKIALFTPIYLASSITEGIKKITPKKTTNPESLTGEFNRNVNTDGSSARSGAAMAMSRASFRCSPEVSAKVACHTTQCDVVLNSNGELEELGSFLKRNGKEDLYKKLFKSRTTSCVPRETPLRAEDIEYSFEFEKVNSGTTFTLPMPCGYVFDCIVNNDENESQPILPLIIEGNLGGVRVAVLDRAVKLTYRVTPSKASGISEETRAELLEAVPKISLSNSIEHRMLVDRLKKISVEDRAEALSTNERKKDWVYCDSARLSNLLDASSGEVLVAANASGIGVCDTYAAIETVKFIEIGIPAVVNSGLVELNSKDSTVRSFDIDRHAISTAVLPNSFRHLDITKRSLSYTGNYSPISILSSLVFHYDNRKKDPGTIGLNLRVAALNGHVGAENFSLLHQFFKSCGLPSQLPNNEPVLHQSREEKLNTDEYVLSHLLAEQDIRPEKFIYFLGELTSRVFLCQDHNSTLFRPTLQAEESHFELELLCGRVPQLLPPYLESLAKRISLVIANRPDLQEILSLYSVNAATGVKNVFETGPIWRRNTHEALRFVEFFALMSNCNLLICVDSNYFFGDRRTHPYEVIGPLLSCVRLEPGDTHSSRLLLSMALRSRQVVLFIGRGLSSPIIRNRDAASEVKLRTQRVGALECLAELEQPPAELKSALLASLIADHRTPSMQPIPAELKTREQYFLPRHLQVALPQNEVIALEMRIAHVQRIALLPWARANLALTLLKHESFRVTLEETCRRPTPPSELTCVTIAEQLVDKPRTPVQFAACSDMLSQFYTKFSNERSPHAVRAPRVPTSIAGSDLFSFYKDTPNFLTELSKLWKEAQRQVEHQSPLTISRLSNSINKPQPEADNSSRKKGRGEYWYSRPYAMGDDARDFDWNAYARLDTPVSMVRTMSAESRPAIGISIEWLSSTESHPTPTGTSFHRMRVLEVFRTIFALARRKEDCDVWLIGLGQAYLFDRFISGKGERNCSCTNATMLLETISRGRVAIYSIFGPDSDPSSGAMNTVFHWGFPENKKRQQKRNKKPVFSKVFGSEILIQNLK